MKAWRWWCGRVGKQVQSGVSMAKIIIIMKHFCLVVCPGLSSSLADADDDGINTKQCSRSCDDGDGGLQNKKSVRNPSGNM